MPRYLAAGECALVVEFGTTADPEFHDQVLALDAALAAHPVPGVIETVPTYRSLMIHFDPHLLTGDALATKLEALPPGTRRGTSPRHWRIPACYDGPYGEDLPELATALNLAQDEIVARHASATYRVVMYGFAPGFVFLSGLPDELFVSRRVTPRPPAPAGALTIANGQALIASIAMPTGWYVLGRTPIATFDPARDPPFPIHIGDTIAFERIEPARFDALAEDPSAWAAS